MTSAMAKGNMEVLEGQSSFTAKEKKEGKKKGLNFKDVKKVGRVGNYDLYDKVPTPKVN